MALRAGTVASLLLTLFQDQWLRVAADDVSLVQAAFNVHVPQFEKASEKLPGWAEDAWLDDLTLSTLRTNGSQTSSAEETTSSDEKTISSIEEGRPRRPLQREGTSGPISWRDRHTLVYPQGKLVFCFIAKNACYNFNGLFNTMNGKGSVTGQAAFGASSFRQFGLSLADVSRKNGWKWAVFVRDPLIRYLSAWGSKCMQQEDRNNCEPSKDFSNHVAGSNESVADFHENILANWRRSGPQHRAPGNEHWAPQQDFCGGLRNAVDYDFVGHLRGDVHSQVRSMLEMVGAPVDAVEKFFPSSGVHGHFSKLDPDVYFKDIGMRKLVSEMYRHDYDLPGL